MITRRQYNQRFIGKLLTILGITLLICGFVAETYSATNPAFTMLQYQPYGDYAYPLYVVGIVLLIIGIAVFQYNPPTRPPPSNPQQPSST